MKIELRRITYNARLSQETAAYAADIYVDGVKRGTVMNEGHGGADRIDPHTLEAEINAYAKSLPPKTYSDGESFPQTAETIFGGLLDRHLAEKRLKRMLGKKTVFVRDGKVYSAPMKFKPVKPGDVVLNTMPLAEAVTLFLSCA